MEGLKPQLKVVGSIRFFIGDDSDLVRLPRFIGVNNDLFVWNFWICEGADSWIDYVVTFRCKQERFEYLLW